MDESGPSDFEMFRKSKGKAKNMGLFSCRLHMRE